MMHRFSQVLTGVLLTFLACVYTAPAEAKCANSPAAKDFNAYILCAVADLSAKYGEFGYNAHYAYTHDIAYGPDHIHAMKPPLTMCVAAVAEVIATAIDIYASETGDKSVFKHLPKIGWERMGVSDIRSYIWVDAQLHSAGTADAVAHFGVGAHAPFSKLVPGSFVNINRTTGTGHAVVFLNFIDKNGDEIKTYSAAVVGFRYFSSQGPGVEPTNPPQHHPGSGLGYRYAFFGNYCPTLPGKRVDCRIIKSDDQGILNTGYMLYPTAWNDNARDSYVAAKVAALFAAYRAKSFTLSTETAPASQAAFTTLISTTDVFHLNPKYEDQRTPGD